MQLEKLLTGGDLRSAGKVNSVINKIYSQKSFDALFTFLFHKDRIRVMRAADAIEKITRGNPHYLSGHKREIIDLCNSASDKELKWHLALLLPRLYLQDKEFKKAWQTLTAWVKDRSNSRIVRVNSIQGLFEMKKQNRNMEQDFNRIVVQLQKENIPSIKARIKIITKAKTM